MQDFWFILGAATIKPSLLDRLGRPRFDSIILSETEVPSDGTPPVLFLKPAAGYLDETATTDMRVLLRNEFLRKDFGSAYGPGTPVISLYTAGKICQLWKNSEAKIRKSLGDANQLLMKAIHDAALKTPYTVRFATLVGACLIDGQLGPQLPLPIGDPLAGEFGFDPTHPTEEWNAIQKFNNSLPALAEARALLMTSGSWEIGCSEKLIFYPQSKRSAN